MRFRARTGVPWWDVPVEYGPWGRGHGLFRRWQRSGTSHRILTRLRSLAAAEGAIVGTCASTPPPTVPISMRPELANKATCRRSHRATEGIAGRIFIGPRDHGLGRSRGGFPTTLHLPVEQRPRYWWARVFNCHQFSEGSSLVVTASGLRRRIGS
ncbi:hypothetical protein AB0A77_31865, partial [Streptomyces varsoviensis]